MRVMNKFIWMRYGFVTLAIFIGGQVLAQNTPPIALENRTPLPPFVLHQYQGAPIHLTDYRGTIVLVNFWATWCAPCVAEFPALLALKENFADQPFEILAINLGERETAITDFLDFLNLINRDKNNLNHEVNFPILLSNSPVNITKSWQIRALPTTIIVDKAGNLAHTTRGIRAWNNAESRTLINTLVRE